MKPLNEQIILVTGASDGLGKRVAQALVARGATVLVHGRDRQKTEAADPTRDPRPFVCPARPLTAGG